MNKPMSTMAKTAITIALTGSGTVYIMRWCVQERIRQSSTYNEAIKHMHNDPNVKDILGEPIRVKSVEVGDSRQYGYGNNSMWVSVPVVGSKRKGFLHYTAVAGDGDPPKPRLSSIEFEVKGSKANKRITLMKDTATELTT